MSNRRKVYIKFNFFFFFCDWLVQSLFISNVSKEMSCACNLESRIFFSILP